MKPVLPFLAAIALAVPGAFVPIALLPLAILAQMAVTVLAVLRFPPGLERFALACGVCGFRQELETAPSGGGMVVHRCCGSGKHVA